MWIGFAVDLWTAEAQVQEVEANMTI
jgi:hypothetical protein